MKKILLILLLASPVFGQTTDTLLIKWFPIQASYDSTCACFTDSASITEIFYSDSVKQSYVTRYSFVKAGDVYVFMNEMRNTAGVFTRAEPVIILPPPISQFDVNRDGMVDLTDLAVLIKELYIRFQP